MSLVTRFLVGLMTVALAGLASSAQAGNYSPNGLPAGQCTWLADGRANEAGWRLQFSQNYGRDAFRWPELVRNAHLYTAPWAGDILVFDSQPGVPYGHVAYCESVQGNGKGYRVTITHANWATGQVVRTIQGYNIRRAEIDVYWKNGRLVGKFVGGTKEYILRGSLGR